jgi:thiamine-monophosphate kinase
LSTPANDVASPSLTVGQLGERQLIERIRRRFNAPSDVLPVGIGDDAAVAPPVRGTLQVLTTDALVEGVHFDLAYSTFADVGFKALAVNSSDVAAMGGIPRLALLSLILPEALHIIDIDRLLDGFAEMAAASRIVLAGGNITRSPGPLIVDVTVIGSVKPRRVLSRSGGRAGDVLYVSGAIGAATAGLEWLRSRAKPAAPDDPKLHECVQRHRRPAPRLRLGALAGQTRAASACIDLSDGLGEAVRQLCEQSGTGAAIDAAELPIHPAAAEWFIDRGKDPILASVAGGDDYELLLAVPSRRRGRFRHVVQHAQVPLTRIGELTGDKEIVLTRNGRREPLPGGYVHF